MPLSRSARSPATSPTPAAPRGFEGLRPVVVLLDVYDPAPTDRPDHRLSEVQRDPPVATLSGQMSEHHDPSVIGSDQILDLDSEVFPLRHERQQRRSDVIAASIKAGQHRLRLEVPLNLRIPGFEHALPITRSDSRHSTAHDLHVLLRHRVAPMSSRASRRVPRLPWSETM